ncbi:hypothetical protein ZWY2020_011442 [Hordeum vulgare]|nr:hypothetical protein ZWY2020_011442 [Hordeum vulgare]
MARLAWSWAGLRAECWPGWVTQGEEQLMFLLLCLQQHKLQRGLLHVETSNPLFPLLPKSKPSSPKNSSVSVRETW